MNNSYYLWLISNESCSYFSNNCSDTFYSSYHLNQMIYSKAIEISLNNEKKKANYDDIRNSIINYNKSKNRYIKNKGLIGENIQKKSKYLCWNDICKW